jgi:NADPH:quinone reductase-like Zn-dependent oxidoreductase
MDGLQLRSLVKESGELELSLVRVTVPEPAADEVVIRVEAAPINPSDIGLLFGPADARTAKVSGPAGSPVVTATIAPNFMRALVGRIGQSLPTGNEGAGVVVSAGANAQELLGKTVAAFGGAMYAQYRTVKASDCLVLSAGTTPREAASCFVNPLTALGMVETMRREGHKGLVHTAAASNLGQMLARICLKDGIALVNIVRRPEQAEMLHAIGSKSVCVTSAPTFLDDLTRALSETGATIAFDAIGGGKLVSQILSCMETAASRTAPAYSRYGSSVHKQVYIYGGLDTGPTELSRAFGFAWGIGGWLLPPFLQKIGTAEAAKLRARVVAELKSTFASHYSHVVSLPQAMQLSNIAAYTKRATGEKYLIDPSLGQS